MLSPCELNSQLITLRPMTMEDLSGFISAGNYPQVWRHMPMNRCENKSVAQAWLQLAIDEMAQGKQIAFVIIDKQSKQIVGSTRLFRYNTTDHTIEIGYTFITPKFQRSYINSHAKYLMLKYAFEQLKVTRVEICTHENNQQSRNAILRIGGQFEGILRKHRRSPNGSYRNTAMFSIIDDEWPQVQQNLLNTGSQIQEFEHVSS